MQKKRFPKMGTWLTVSGFVSCGSVVLSVFVASGFATAVGVLAVVGLGAFLLTILAFKRKLDEGEQMHDAVEQRCDSILDQVKLDKDKLKERSINAIFGLSEAETQIGPNIANLETGEREHFYAALVAFAKGVVRYVSGEQPSLPSTSQLIPDGYRSAGSDKE